VYVILLQVFNYAHTMCSMLHVIHTFLRVHLQNCIYVHNEILFALPPSSPSSFPSLPPSLCPSDNRPQKKDNTNVEKKVCDEYETQLASYRLHGGFWRQVSAAEAVTHTHSLSHTYTTPLERRLVHALPPEWIQDVDSGQKEDRRDVRSLGVCGEKTEEEE